jgi:uncharacterized protein (DUF952 family)
VTEVREARIFHIVAPDDWADANAAGRYLPAGFARDGFVHFSFADQVARVANARYRNEPALIAVEVDPRDLDVVVEDSYQAGEEFPHVYQPVPTAAAVARHPLTRDENGDWVFNRGPASAAASPDR